MEKRQVDVAVLSDLHLGTYGCRAKEITHYLKSISPQILILNGDIIDIWQFSKRYFPSSHMAVIQQVFHLLATIQVVLWGKPEQSFSHVGFPLLPSLLFSERTR